MTIANIRMYGVSLAWVVLAASAVFAQGSPEGQRRLQDPRAQIEAQQDPGFGQYLFPPELVMQNQQKIALRAEQRATITEALQQFQSNLVNIQWRMQDETQKLSELVHPARVSEADVLAQVDRVLGVEREMKRAHLTLLIRIKNTLTSEQQATLRSGRGEERGDRKE